MITIKLRGGLGNQMFQYAFGKAAAMRLNTKLALDPHGYNAREHAPNDTVRHYKLDVFNIKADVIDRAQWEKLNTLPRRIIRKIKNRLFPENPWVFDVQRLDCSDGEYLIGFWQSEKYFADIQKQLREDFILKKPLSSASEDMRKRISEKRVSVSLSIRRVDYLKDPEFRDAVCTSEYYNRALNYIAKKLSIDTKELYVFITTDDKQWVTDHLHIPCPYEFICVDGPTDLDYEWLYLISCTSHHIIANSTFSWWGAWLDQKPDTIVVAPKHWVSDPKKDTSDIIPERWIKM